MTEDTITLDSLENLAQYFEYAAEQARIIRDVAESGDISPKDAATDIRLLLRNINALAGTKP